MKSDKSIFASIVSVMAICIVSTLAASACSGSAGGTTGRSPLPTGAAASDPQLLLGRTVFSENCARCHGRTGQGGIGPSFNDGTLLKVFPTATQQIEFVKKGEGAMPAWGGVLTEAQLEAVVRYEREVLSKPPSSTANLERASDQPSSSARQVCSKATKGDIFNGALGVDTVSPLHPTWDLATHTYSCVFHYADGSYMTLSVKDMSSADETTAYYDHLAKQLGNVKTWKIPGAQGAFNTSNGSAVVRKDYKVLLVDMSHIPGSFGIPADSRENNSANVAFVLLACWTGS